MSAISNNVLTASRTRPATPKDIRGFTGCRVRMVVIDSELLYRDRVLVGDLVCYVKRVDGKGAGEAILVDHDGKGYGISLRRIKSITRWGPGDPVYTVAIDHAGKAEASRQAERGGHGKQLCGRCGNELPDGRAHISGRGCSA